MTYSDTDIWQALHNGDIEIDPFNEDQLGTNSYDVRLGNDFYEVRWDERGPFFVGPYHFEDGEKVYIPVSGTLLGMTKEKIATRGKIGAELRSRSTTRRVGITTNCDAGLGDIGYGFIEDLGNGFGRKINNGYWTIELTAFVSNSLIIELLTALDTWLTRNGFGIAYLSKIVKKRRNNRPFLIVGERIAQIVFFECKSAPTKEYDGQYQVDWPLNMIPKEYRDRVVSPEDVR
jgi:deoxycytidine triphosphate deaminase